MSTASAGPVATARLEPQSRPPLVAAARDAAALAGRNLRHIPRQPELLVFATIQPIMFVLMFAYVFGGAIDTPGLDYIDFLIPGIIVQTLAFGSVATGVGLAEDLHGGLIDRFRSLPMARSAVLAGRTLSDLVRNAFALALMLAVGHLIGFRFDSGAAEIAAGILIALLFGFALSWISAIVGLSVRTAEAAQSASFIWLFPLVFASSAFVPVESMPAALEAVAQYTPVTVTVDALRALFLGGDVGDSALLSVAWSVGLTAVFAPLAVARYRRTATS
jgi:ABC-2 type transport system permease protein/oleandomycin transport system permease protein